MLRPEDNFKNIEKLKVIARSPALNKTESGNQSYLVQDDEAISCKLAKIVTFTKWDCFASLSNGERGYGGTGERVNKANCMRPSVAPSLRPGPFSAGTG